MKISLLKRREDYDAIFAASLSAFLTRYFNWSGEVTTAHKSGLRFRQNAVLNVVYPSGMAHQKLAPLTREFTYAKSAKRRWLQTIYVALATRAPWAWLASPRAFTVTNAPAIMANWVILPGNHSFRIIDTAHDISIVFPKAGFDRRFFVQDAKVRQAFAFLPAPKVFEVQEGWFTEARILGLPLNRLTDSAQQKTALDFAVAALLALRAATVREVSMQAWAAALAQKITAHIGDGLSEKTKGGVHAIQAAAHHILREAGPQVIRVCQSHGDFQPANIMVGAAQTYLIDWEYSRERFAHYDYLVFQTECRHADGLGARLHNELAAAELENGLNGWGARQNGPVSGLFAIFILEDLLLKLEETAASAILDKGLFLDPWLREIEPFITRLAAR